MKNTIDPMDEYNMGEFPTLLTGSGKFHTQMTPKFEKRKVWETPNPKLIKAIIPGTIIDVYVKNGQEVKKGEILLILEAMKMQNQILMPFDGKIKKVWVKSDQKIPKNELMIELV
jgi:biotin carboxyl carrier protein